MKDKELSEIIGIPGSTVKEWKKAKNYRKFIYEFLKNIDKKELKKKFDAIDEIYDLKK